MHRFWHSANSSDGLNFEGFAHVVAKFYKNVCSGAIPSGRNGLFNDNRNGLGV